MSKKSIQEEAVNETYEDWRQEEQEEQEEENLAFKCTAKLNLEPLPGKMLLEPINKLSKKPVSSWTPDDVIPIAEILAGRIAIDGTRDNFEGACAFTSISTDFSNYVSKYPDIHAIVDPVYVVADVGGQQLPSFNIDNYPPVGSPISPLVPVSFNGSSYIWVFNGPDAIHVHHFIGWLQAQVPGIKVFMFNSVHPALCF